MPKYLFQGSYIGEGLKGLATDGGTPRVEGDGPGHYQVARLPGARGALTLNALNALNA